MGAQPSFFSRLLERARAADSLLCVGLDPHPEFLGEPSAEGARDFCLKLIEATAEFATAFKPNSAFFEVFGAPGWAALEDVIAAVPKETPVILDAKRGDIASSARLYAQAAFESLGAEALTVSPYLGHDAVEPFIEDPARGVFLLCKTSNPGSDDIQLLGGDEEPLYLSVARLASQWNERDNVGLVVGATDAEALAAVRAVAPRLWILAPGVGAQGGDLEAALAAGLRPDGFGMLIPVSRGISAAPDPHEEAARMVEAINRTRSTQSHSGRRKGVSAPGALPADGLSQEKAALADALLEAGCVMFGDFELKSGDRSPIYFDLRLLAGRPNLLSRVAAAYRPILERLTFDRLAAIPYAGLPIATAIALQSDRPFIYPRKEVKEYGTRAEIEGGFEPGETAVLIDDLATSGGSKFEAADKLTAAGLQVRDVVILIDRAGGAHESLAAAGLELHSVFTLPQLIDHWRATDRVDRSLLTKVDEFLAREAGGSAKA
ncbi:MAG: orotidine-5'-phosphate decarboxylase [Anaerolineales bacterium]|nr:orotidine-5'-phosphate decarboxylase [Anaerolineales bacterium]